MLVVAIVLAILLFFVLGPVAGAGCGSSRCRRRHLSCSACFDSGQLRAGFSDGLAEPARLPRASQAIPTSSNFVLSTPGSSFVPTLGGADSPTGTRFNTALEQSFQLKRRQTCGTAACSGRDRPQRGRRHDVTAVNPKTTILRRGLSMIALPAWIMAEIGEDFNEVMAYPKIDLPMYKPLEERRGRTASCRTSTRLRSNSITLMETNQRFIEAYMVGLNHEFARKLLWREYPTDQRGSYFRQFWSVGDTIDSEGLSEDALKEKLYDIPEIHRWASNLRARRPQQPRPPVSRRAASSAHHPRRIAQEVSRTP